MPGTINFVACATYAKELQYVIKSLKNETVNLNILKSECCTFKAKKSYINNSQTIIQHINKNSFNLIPSSCNIYKIGLHQNSNDVAPPLCLEMIVPQELINYYISQGCYIVTPGWIKQWEILVKKKWNFDEKTAKLFFNDAASQIIVFDTGIYENYKNKLDEFSLFSGLKYNIVPVGIKYFQNFITNIINTYKLELYDEQIKAIKIETNKKIADYAMIFNLIPEIAKIDTEKAIIIQIFHLFNLLFAPQRIIYISIENNKINWIETSNGTEIEEPELHKIIDFQQPNEILVNTDGFILKLNNLTRLLGFIVIEKIHFTEFIEKYVILSKSLCSIFSLLIVNARNYSEILFSKQIAEENENKFRTMYEQFRALSEELAEKNHEYLLLTEEYQSQNEELITLNNALFETNLKIKENEIKLEKLNATKDKFFSIIAHDLRSPFTVLLGYSNLAVQNPQMSIAEILNLIKSINEVSKQTYSLLENLLEWAKIQKGQLKPNITKTDCNSIIYEMSVLFSGIASQKEIIIETIIEETLYCLADREMVTTVIRNLVSNAIKFTYPKGRIIISASSDSGRIKFSIIDNGIGIDSQYINNIFGIENKMSKLGTANEKGSGLGLILCKEFIILNNGEITVKSTPCKGSEFIFWLPAFTQAVE